VVGARRISQWYDVRSAVALTAEHQRGGRLGPEQGGDVDPSPPYERVVEQAGFGWNDLRRQASSGAITSPLANQPMAGSTPAGNRREVGHVGMPIRRAMLSPIT
jgi:hypothetical protein